MGYLYVFHVVGADDRTRCLMGEHPARQVLYLGATIAVSFLLCTGKRHR